MTLKTIEGTFIAPQGKYALVVGRFNSFVVESLVSGAVDALVRHGVKESDITIIRAPGAFEIPLVTFGTALLLFSSFFVVLALNGAQKGNRKQLIGWLVATILCGVFFVGMQVYEFTHFVHKGLTLSRNMFGASFFILTGFHGTHVTIGVIWLLTMFVLALRGKLTPNRSLNLEMAALYWHFVDVVWVVIFPVVYLIR